MKQTALQVHKWWLMRAALVLLITVLADGLAASLLAKPFLWCLLIGSSLSLSMTVFVVIPLLR